jgi:hypothetical protein
MALDYKNFKESSKAALNQEFGSKLSSITIKDLQRFLKKNADGSVTADGLFGPVTKQAALFYVWNGPVKTNYTGNERSKDSQETGNLKTAGPPPATIVGSNAWCHQQMERPKSAGEILDYNVNAVVSAAMLYLGLKELAALDAALVSNRANSISAELNWSIVSKTGQTRAQHVGQHSVNNLQKQYYGVFYGNPVNVTNNAWAARGGLQPIQQGTVDVYNIPYANAGYLGGYASQGQNLNYVTVIVQKGTNNLITAYPSFGN